MELVDDFGMELEYLKAADDNQKSYSSQLISEGLTEREKQALSEAIDRSILSRPSPDPSIDASAKITGSGRALPILINIGAFVIVAAVFAFFTLSFQERRYRMALDESRYYSTEGKILEAYKRQSEQQLKEKDNLIYRILKQLESLETQKEEMSRLMDLNVAKKREILDEEIAKNRALEVERLKTLGYEEERISTLMSEFDQNAVQARDSEIVSYREESLKLLKDREEAIIAEISAKERALRISTENNGVEIETLDPETAAALSQLTQISEDRERESLLMDQINASYLQAIDKIAVYDTEAALTGLANLRSLYSQSPLRNLPNISKRYPVDLSIIETLEAFVRQRQVWVETPVTLLAFEDEQDSSEEVIEEETEIAKLRASIQQMKEQLANQEQRILFLANTSNEKDEVIEELAWKLDKSLEMIELETAKGLETGRNLAFEDVRSILEAYSDLESTDVVTAMSGDISTAFSDEKVDQVYREFLNVLQSFAARYADIQASFTFVGTATLITGTRVVVEPLVPTLYEKGTHMEIRQMTGEGMYRVVARGAVESSVPGKITATISEFPFDNAAPKVNDQVYVSAVAN